MKIDTNCIIHITQNNTTKLINLWNLWQRILFRSTLLLLVHIRRWQLWLPLKLLMNYMTKLNLISQLIRKAILIHIRSVIVWKCMTLKTLVYVCMYVQILNQSCQLTFTNNDLCTLNNTKTFFLKLKDPKQ